MNICTVTTRRRIPFASVLAESFLQHHPDGSISALVADAGPEQLDQPASPLRLLTPYELGWGRGEMSRMAMTWPEKLLKRALIPDLLRFLIQTFFRPALFFADDTFIFSPLDSVEALAEEAGLVLSLRTGAPLPSDGRTPGQTELLEAGVHGTGFAAVGPSAEDRLELWRDLIQTELVGTDSEVVPARIFDLLAAVFPCRIMGDPAAGISLWNIWDRCVVQGRTGPEVDGVPVKFAQFEGFDPDRSHLLSTEQGRKPRILLSEREDLRKLTSDYRRRLLAAGFVEAGRHRYGFEYLPCGVKVDERMQRLYRDQLRAATAGEALPPPDPFDAEESEHFVRWLNSPDEAGRAPSIPRYLYALYEERGDLRAAFPGIARVDAGRFLRWVNEYGAEEAGIPQELRPVFQEGQTPEPEGQPVEADTSGAGPAGSVQSSDEEANAEEQTAVEPRLPFGVNLVGYFRAELGVGEMGRLILTGLEGAQIPFATTAYSAWLSRQTHPYTQLGKEFAYDTNLFCVNADQLPSVVRDYGPRILEDRYNIGVWWWEVDVFPPQMAASANYLDEIWVGSEYVGRAIVGATDKLVRLLPIPVRRIDAAPLDRKAFGIPDGFLFLASFDFLSIFERKNPMAVVQAYKQAFQPGEGAALLIKTINGEDHLLQLEELKVAAVDRPDIRIMDRVLPEEDKDRLLATCDCYVSLHRAEGYGLGMAEAMALGKPIIATNYSGNLTFLNETNSFLVGYSLVPVPPEAGPYPQGAVWAEPDVGQAAEFMRTVFARPEEARRLGAKARTDALSLHSPEVTGRFLQERLTEIRLMRGASAAESGSRA